MDPFGDLPTSSQSRFEKPYKWSDLQKTHLRARLALDPKTQYDAFALRYKSFLADGYIEANPSGLFSDAYDAVPGSYIVVIYSGTEAVGSARACTMDVVDESSPARAVPANAVFAEEVGELVRRVPDAGRPKRVMEIGRLVTHPAFTANYGLVFLLFRLVGHLIRELDADVVLSCVRQNHVPFYNRLRFELIAGPRSYPGVKFDTYLMTSTRLICDDLRRIAPVLDVEPSLGPAYAGLLGGKDTPVLAPASG